MSIGSNEPSEEAHFFGYYFCFAVCAALVVVSLFSFSFLFVCFYSTDGSM